MCRRRRRHLLSLFETASFLYWACFSHDALSPARCHFGPRARPHGPRLRANSWSASTSSSPRPGMSSGRASRSSPDWLYYVSRCTRPCCWTVQECTMSHLHARQVCYIPRVPEQRGDGAGCEGSDYGYAASSIQRKVGPISFAEGPSPSSPSPSLSSHPPWCSRSGGSEWEPYADLRFCR